MSERVSITVDDHVAVVTLNRPDKHNALDGAMFEGIAEAAGEVAGDPSVRAVVLHGAGPSFCSGLDLGSLMTGPVSLDDILQRPEGRRANAAQRVCTDWIDAPAPVIAAIHGNCFGGGLQIALGADVRFAAPDARLSVMESKWGLVPDMGITSTLPRLVRIDVAKELTYTGRVVTGTEAQALGLVTRLSDDPRTDALALAAEIASRNPDAIKIMKRLVDASWTLSFDDGVREERDQTEGMIGSKNQLEAVMANLEQRPGQFED